MDYFVILKKDRHPHSEGFKYGPVDMAGYMSLYNDGYIDDEARVFYVGLTRATERLHLIHPMFSQGYSIPY